MIIDNNYSIDEKTYICGIGAQKAGTTFLADYLSKHPEFLMSELKELHYFDAKFLPKLSGNFNTRFENKVDYFVSQLKKGKRFNSQLLFALIKRIDAYKSDNYKSYFEYYVKKDHKAFGEITPAYSMLSKDHFKSIRDIFPNHKFIFLLRNPVDRFWSQINFEIQSKKSDENALEILEKCLNLDSFVLRNNYKRTIEELLSVVEKKNVYIDFYENIFSEESEKTVDNISKFIGISNRYDLINKKEKINKTDYKVRMDETSKLKVIHHFKEVYEYIFKMYDNVPQNWINDYNNYIENNKGS